MSAVDRARRAAIAAFALAWIAGCGEPPAPPPMPEPSSVELESLGEGAIAGTIGGEAFSAADVRFRVTSFPGRERVDLWIADRPIERCGLPVQREHTLVWARFAGRTELAAGTYELAGGEGEDELEVHYERPGEGRSIDAVHRGRARIEITEASPARLAGRLRICFADEARSCVGGSFEATPCLSRIDGRAVREPPGLVDEALEPPRGTGAAR